MATNDAASKELAPTGKLGVDAGSEAGFDILTSGTDNTGYATLRVGGAQRLYRVNLLNGSVTRLGTFAAPVVDVALPAR